LFELTIQELSCPNAVTDDSGSLQSQKKVNRLKAN
jgi:hypothetical protein